VVNIVICVLTFVYEGLCRVHRDGACEAAWPQRMCTIGCNRVHGL
jgi:hypothetical protein